ncbi:MAG: M20/M25/M40 family metallo-hydrolase, partial [Betaproteobacteria bacterium]|nr:M20/M25/M40 family metallo-hydrolase [Betaproteobacteria bacterium]
MSRQRALEQIARHFDSGAFMSDLARRVAIKTESQVPESHPFLRSYLTDEIGPVLSQMGYEIQIIDNPAGVAAPFLVARRIEDPTLPTVLTYGHGDVIRGLDAQWQSGLDPWKLTRVGSRYYGRGTADNKGQHSINIAALRAVLQVRGKLGFNSVFMIDTGEEIGSPGLHEFARQYR